MHDSGAHAFGVGLCFVEEMCLMGFELGKVDIGFQVGEVDLGVYASKVFCVYRAYLDV